METGIELRNEEEKSLIGEIESVWAGFTQPAVKDADAYQYAANNRKALKTYIKQLDEVRKGHTRPVDELKKQILSFFDNKLAILETAQRQIDKAMLDYDAEIQRERARKQRELEEYARKQAEEERSKLEALALKALEQGNEAKAEALVVKAEEVKEVVPVLAPVQPIAEGTGFRELWKFEIVDAKALPREYLKPDEVSLGQVVRATKGKLQIPGIRIWSEKIVQGRSF
jgi:hypothetical protein